MRLNPLAQGAEANCKVVADFPIGDRASVCLWTSSAA